MLSEGNINKHDTVFNVCPTRLFIISAWDLIHTSSTVIYLQRDRQIIYHVDSFISQIIDLIEST